jgi:hypothetical protein
VKLLNDIAGSFSGGVLKLFIGIFWAKMCWYFYQHYIQESVATVTGRVLSRRI